VITKPLHNTQRLIKTNADGSIIIHLLLIENYELDRLLLGFGNGLEVIKPEKLRKRMQTIVYKTLERYQEIL
jgi:predicted DNA-binding transcriptional regulator YafY